MILFFGPPGSGKSVQGQLLVTRNGWQWLSTGELFRNSKDPDVLKRLATGELIDDELTNRVLSTALDEINNDMKVVLDGYPRNTHQAEWLSSHLEKRGRAINCVVLFEVPKEELVKRLSGRGRAEDTLNVIEKRLDIYHEKTKPVLDYYREQGVPMLIVDGLGEVDDIHERIQSAVVDCLSDK